MVCLDPDCESLSTAGRRQETALVVLPPFDSYRQRGRNNHSLDGGRRDEGETQLVGDFDARSFCKSYCARLSCVVGVTSRDALAGTNRIFTQLPEELWPCSMASHPHQIAGAKTCLNRFVSNISLEQASRPERAIAKADWRRAAQRATAIRVHLDNRLASETFPLL